MPRCQLVLFPPGSHCSGPMEAHSNPLLATTANSIHREPLPTSAPPLGGGGALTGFRLHSSVIISQGLDF